MSQEYNPMTILHPEKGRKRKRLLLSFENDDDEEKKDLSVGLLPLEEVVNPSKDGVDTTVSVNGVNDSGKNENDSINYGLRNTKRSKKNDSINGKKTS